MPEFLVRFSRKERWPYPGDSFTETKFGILLVESENRVDAFAAAYDYLVRRGHSVDLMLTNKYKEGPDEMNHYKFTDADLEQMRLLGVPVDEYDGDTRIYSVELHSVSHSGRVLSVANEASLNLSCHKADAV
jgi:hypothetical protein